MRGDPLDLFHSPVREWFRRSFAAATRPQRLGWPPIARRESTLILAPTGTGKTLAAFLASLDRLMFDSPREKAARCRVLYISPLKALAVDVERNLRAPLAGISNVATTEALPFHTPLITLRTGDTPSSERARFLRDPGDILITTPESLYLMLTSNARERLRSVQTVIIDEIHALVSTKRGAHLALSLERLEAIVSGPLQRIGLSATQRPLEEVARFLGGAHAKRTRDGKASKTAQEAVDDEFAAPAGAVAYRDVTIVDASEPKRLDIRVQVPVEDMAKVGAAAEPAPFEIRSGPAYHRTDQD